MVERAGSGVEAEAGGRDGTGGLLVEVDVQQAFLRRSGNVWTAAGAGGEAPVGVDGAPAGGDLEGVADGPAGFDTGIEILLQPLSYALLIGPDVDRLADKAGAGLDEVSAGGQQAIVLGVEDGLEAEVGVGAQLGAVAAQILIDEAQVEFHARDVGGFRGQVGADEQIGWAGGVLAETDENAVVGLGFFRAGDRLAGIGRRCGWWAEGLVGGVVDAVGLDGVERADGFGGRDGLAFNRLHVGEDLLLRAGLAAFDADLAQHARRRESALVAIGEIGCPVLGIEGVGKQCGAVGLGRQIAFADKLASLGVVGG